MVPRVLIVDDEPRLLAALARVLRPWSARWHFAYATSGAEAIEHVRDNLVDAVVTDVFMPEMDGFELIRKLRATRPELPIVALSGGGRYGMVHMSQVARSLGANRALTKPVAPELLIQTLEEVLRGSADPPAVEMTSRSAPVEEEREPSGAADPDPTPPIASRVDPEFEELLADFDMVDLDSCDDTVFGLWPSGRIAYVNHGWFRFARRNRGEPAISQWWGLGRSIFDAISDALRPYYLHSYRTSLEEGDVREHEYECSSDTSYRRFHQIVYPLRRGGGGLLVVNSPVVDRPHDPGERPPKRPDRSVHVDEDGLIRQCSHCRRVRSCSPSEAWDWVPEWVRRCPENTSHTLCPTCLGYFYPETSVDR